MSEMLIAYAITVATAVLGALIGWIANYGTATRPDYCRAKQQDAYRDGRACLVFIVWSWAWPWFLLRAFTRAVRRTLAEAER